MKAAEAKKAAEEAAAKEAAAREAAAKAAAAEANQAAGALLIFFFSWVVVSVGEKIAIEKEVKANPPTAAKTPKEKAEATLKTKMENVETEVGEDCRP